MILIDDRLILDKFVTDFCEILEKPTNNQSLGERIKKASKF